MLGKILILYMVWAQLLRVRTSNIVKRSRSCRNNICNFEWNVDYKFTMMWHNRTSEEPNFQPILLDRSNILRRRATTANCTEIYEAVLFSEFEDLVSTGDGEYRMVYAINGQIPGPEIVVSEGDTVVVRIYNRLKTEGLTIHWHGLLQRGTPWMDGVPMISQCPIIPGQMFEYRFLAEPVGTHWYHAHTNTMGSDGLSGAFIVLPKEATTTPGYTAEFFAVIQDWTRRSSLETSETYRSKLFGLDDYDGKCQPAVYMPDGGTSIFPFNVGLVNGRGRRYTDTFKNGEKSYFPMETFTVQMGGTYRFRIINVGFATPFKITFEGHAISVLALDGNEVEEQNCDAVVLTPGESVDIKLQAKRLPNNYYIAIETLPTRTLWHPIKTPRKTYAILNYQGVNRFRAPVSMTRPCTAQNPCDVVNQIYGTTPVRSNVTNIHLGRLKATSAVLQKFPVPIESPFSALQEFFLHFHINRDHPAINGKRFRYPTSALQTYPTINGSIPCDPSHCTANGCRCTHTIKVEIHNTIQIVLFSKGMKVPHSVHVHGHQFHVVKIGYPKYDTITGKTTAPNRDIRCLNNDCTDATWTDPSWQYGVPGLNLKNPPLKDTVSIPAGGYVVIRITADNPGYWALHSTFGHHLSQGMTVIVQEGEISDMMAPPPNFPVCNSFQSSQEYIESAIREQSKNLALKRQTKIVSFEKKTESHKSNQRLKVQETMKTSNVPANPAISSRDFNTNDFLTFLFGGKGVSTPAPSHARQQRRFTSTPKPTMCDDSPWLCIHGQPIFQNSK
ncbi:uncharacterized protein LOC125666817 [Ostrea edulis]|uniref:uncharacterized protein LOC125666817 n=1 Tax=Ostrea edulis TaxID=37623 RepID=UPI0024AF5282|nr:uncharacterized protein LOC125666817 [Ostrea edulis]